MVERGANGKNIAIVLVEPRSPGNIGSVARAMKNTGLGRLVLVNPVDFKNDEAYSMACKARDVLLSAELFTHLNDAVEDCGLVVGTTRRKGRFRWPVLTLDEALPEIVKFSKKNKVALLFGREDSGLKNDEISLCDILMEIPSHTDYPSFNLSHAVIIVAHRLFLAENPAEPSIEVVSKKDMEEMYLHLERALRRLGYGEKGGEYLLQSVLRNFRRLLGRTGLMRKELNMLRGIFTMIEEKLQS